MVGIYKITAPSGEIYIGQSIDIKRRWAVYKNIRCKDQPAVYASIVKNGYESHKFEVIHELPSDVSKKVMNNYEWLYYDLYKNVGALFLNLSYPGKGGVICKETMMKTIDNLRAINTGRKLPKSQIQKVLNSRKWYKHSEQTKEKMRLSHKGVPKSESHIKNMSVPIIQYSVFGEFIREWDSSTQAGRELGIDNSCILKCAKNKKYVNSAGGFKWGLKL